MTARAPVDERCDCDVMHPLVFKAIAGLLVWVVIAAWAFVGGGYSFLALGVVTVFALGLILIPLSMWHIWHTHDDPARPRWPKESFRAWAAHDVDICQGRLKGSEAAITALLPVVAVALGMTA